MRGPLCGLSPASPQLTARLSTPAPAGVVLLKGKAACEVDTADELLTAELMFNGTLIGLDKHQLVCVRVCVWVCVGVWGHRFGCVGGCC